MDENKKFTTNTGGVRIHMCCASCEHCGRDDAKDLSRICKKGNGVHANDYLCDDWTIETTPRDKQHRDARSLNDVVLNPTGGVKKPEYIAFVQERLKEMDIYLASKKSELSQLVRDDMAARGVDINEKVVVPKVNRMLKEIHGKYISSMPEDFEQNYGSRYMVMETEPERERSRLKDRVGIAVKSQ